MLYFSRHYIISLKMYMVMYVYYVYIVFFKEIIEKDEETPKADIRIIRSR